ncbi:hypothetical protein P879_03237, partial [Paragonimus westermani]
SDSPPVSRFCHRATGHRRDGILIHEKDSVLLCSGPDRSNPPHVAKIMTLFSDPNSATGHRRDGILIHEKDSVLLCSGPDRSNPPHVAKIMTLFSDPNSGKCH